MNGSTGGVLLGLQQFLDDVSATTAASSGSSREAKSAASLAKASPPHQDRTTISPRVDGSMPRTASITPWRLAARDRFPDRP